MSTPIRRARGEVGAAVRHHSDKPDVVEDARRTLKIAKAEEYVRRLVDDAPLLTDEQRDRLAVLIRGSAA